MPTAETLIPRSPSSCWREFTDAARLIGWLPGLRRARVVASRPDGLPLEVAYEFAPSRSYTLVYDYDVEALTVRWSPRVGQRDAVLGSITFTPAGDGTHVSYTLEPSAARSSAGDSFDDPEELLQAFARWMLRTRA
jgi:uncharacterized protein YndB with AHSA1/START domain